MSVSLVASLRRPRRTIARLDAGRPTLATIPRRTWAALTAIAFGGSAAYGASLALVLPDWRPTKAGLWLTASAGLGWCVFGPLLVVVTRRNPFSCAHACLIAMAYGEGVLISGGGLNLFVLAAGWRQAIDARKTNLAIVGMSNVVMAGMLAGQLRSLGVPIRTTLLLWNAGLNGSGGLFFLVLRRMLRG